VLRWTPFQSITAPAEQACIAGSPEAFVHNGRSWSVLATADHDKAASLSNIAIAIAIASIDPQRPEFRRLTDAGSPRRWRPDPEYFVNDTGVHDHHNRARSMRKTMIPEGVWRVDTGLGPPQR